MTAQATLSASIVGLLSGAVDIGDVAHSLSFTPSITFGDGSGANQITRIFADNRTISASSNDDLDLAGVLVDAIGQTVALARVRGILIRAAAANVNNIVVGGASSNGFISWAGASAHTVIVRPGGLLLLAAPDATAYGVTAGTADILRIANSGAGSTVNYDIVILGATS